jgi:transcriptional regulator with XRE-family HTH domain
MDFKTRLNELLDEIDMKQSKLADILNLKSSAISKYKIGLTQPSIITLIKMADVFKVSVDYLLGLSSIKNPYAKEAFSPKEAEIIARYRRLIKENQIRVDERISAMLDGQRR